MAEYLHEKKRRTVWWGSDRPENLERHPTGFDLKGNLESRKHHITCMAWSPDGKLVLIASGGVLYMLDAENELAELGTPQACGTTEVFAIAWHPFGKEFVTPGRPNCLQRWSYGAKLGMQRVGEIVGVPACVRELSFSADGKRLSAALENCEYIIWRYSTHKPDLIDTHKYRNPLNICGTLFCATASPNRELLAVGSGEGSVVVYYFDGVQKRVMAKDGIAHQQLVYDIAWHPNGKTLCSCSGDGYIRFWDVDSGSCQREIGPSGGKIWSVTYTRDGRHVMGIFQDMTIRVWDSVDFRKMEVLHFQCQDRPDLYLSAHPSAPRIISPGKCDLSVRLWEVSPQKLEERYHRVMKWADLRAHFHYLIWKKFGVTMTPRKDRLFKIITVVVGLLLGALAILSDIGGVWTSYLQLMNPVPAQEKRIPADTSPATGTWQPPASIPKLTPRPTTSLKPGP